MKMNAREALDAYYESAATWRKDQVDGLRLSRRIAWIVAAVAALIAVVEAIAIAGLTPLKTVEPLTLLVDRNTGYVQTLKPLEPAQVGGNTALTQSFLVQYVIARESFDITTIQDSYRKVSLWSEGTARQAYVAGVQPSNPDSLLARLPRSTIVETRVKSVTPMANNMALVRYETIRRDAGGQAQPPQAWVVAMQYGYSNEAMRVEDRYINPLGFKVRHYQRNAEALNPAPAVPPPASGSTGAPAQSTGIVVPPGLPSKQAPDGRRLANGVVLTP